MSEFNFPLSVAPKYRREYYKNWKLATHNTGRLMLLAGDQKIEHLNDDFFGKDIAPDDANPKHLFKIAEQAKIGVFAAHLGLIASYGRDYPDIPYLIKLNSKTNLIKTEQRDPISGLLTTVEQVLDFKKHSGLKIVGVGYTLYPGSDFEPEMLEQVGQIIYQAHAHGLLVVLWLYPRGKAVKKETDSHLVAGMAGLGASLGADFVKVIHPTGMTASKYKEIIQAAGRTGVIFSGGSQISVKKFLEILAIQIKNGASGNATGRNVHQKPLAEAVRFANAISAISLDGTSVEQAYKIYLKKGGK